jgi:hypothetical protein
MAPPELLFSFILGVYTLNVASQAFYRWSVAKNWRPVRKGLFAIQSPAKSGFIPRSSSGRELLSMVTCL